MRTSHKMNQIKLVRLVLCVIFIAGCSSPHHFVAPEPIPDDRVNVPEPAYQEINILGDGFDKQFTEQLEQFLDFSRFFRAITGNRKEAYNVDAFDEVSNSSWFENRINLGGWTKEMVMRGPNQGAKPNPEEIWTVVSAKAEGVTPGFTIKDEQGHRYVIKFDPVGYSEMSTGAEVVGTKLFYAAGFHVPENYIVYFDVKNLRLGEGVKYTDEKGRNRLMTQADLDAVLARIEAQPNGLVRAVASKYISGIPKGPFKYKGTRDDDFNDLVPHQHRRELRGLRYIAAWLNHFDTKANNSFTSFVDEGYLRHFLIDFGSTLGSQGDEPMPPYVGHENTVDPHAITLKIATLGLYVQPWEKHWHIPFKSIGHFESANFDPQGYKPIIPNPAFENATARDAFWAGKIIMSFTDALLEAAVASGEYSDPNAAAFLTRRLIERRDIVGRFAFSQVNPLDAFRLKMEDKKQVVVAFKDLAIEAGFEQLVNTIYRFELTDQENRQLFGGSANAVSEIQFPTKTLEPLKDRALLSIAVKTQRNDSDWSQPVRVFIQKKDDDLKIIGLKRE